MASKKKVEDVEAREDKKAVKASKKANAPAPKETKKAGQKAKAPVKEEAKPQKKKKAEPVEEAKVEETAEAITPETSKEAKEEEAAQKKPFTTARPKPLPRPVEKSTLDLDEETKRLRAAMESSSPQGAIQSVGPPQASTGTSPGFRSSIKSISSAYGLLPGATVSV